MVIVAPSAQLCLSKVMAELFARVVDVINTHTLELNSRLSQCTRYLPF